MKVADTALRRRRENGLAEVRSSITTLNDGFLKLNGAIFGMDGMGGLLRDFKDFKEGMRDERHDMKEDLRSLVYRMRKVEEKVLGKAEDAEGRRS